MIKLIAMDLDGTLCDTADIHYKALNQAMMEVEKFEIPYSVHIKHFNGQTTSTKLNKLVLDGVIQQKNINKIKTLKQEYTTEAIESTLKPDTQKLDMLFKLKQDGFKLAIGTNCIRKTAELMLQKSDLFDLIEFIVTNEDVKNPKPDKEVWINCINHFGVLPTETIIIDDHDLGISAAVDTGAYWAKVKNPDELTYDFLMNYITKVQEKE